MSKEQYELPDFHPATGHLHSCTDRTTCDCAAWLYCIAQDAELLLQDGHAVPYIR